MPRFTNHSVGRFVGRRHDLFPQTEPKPTPGAVEDLMREIYLASRQVTRAEAGAIIGGKLRRHRMDTFYRAAPNVNGIWIAWHVKGKAEVVLSYLSDGEMDDPELDLILELILNQLNSPRRRRGGDSSAVS
jgi:hypothetical protein